MGRFVDNERSLGLGSTVGVSLRWTSPGLPSCDLGLAPTRCESPIGVFNNPAKTKPTKRRSESGLTVGTVVEEDAKDGLGRLPNTFVELHSLGLPVNQGSGTHEMRGPDNAVRHAQQVQG